MKRTTAVRLLVRISHALDEADAYEASDALTRFAFEFLTRGQGQEEIDENAIADKYVRFLSGYHGWQPTEDLDPKDPSNYQIGLRLRTPPRNRVLSPDEVLQWMREESEKEKSVGTA